MKAVLIFLIFSLAIATGYARVDESFDYKQSVKLYSSNEYLNKMFKSSVQLRAQRLFTFVNHSVAQNERTAIKNNMSKHHLTGLLDDMDWDALIQRSEIKK